MDYQQLSKTEQADAIRRRLATLERDHLEVSLDVDAAGSAGNPPQAQRADELAATIETLRDRLAGLED